MDGACFGNGSPNARSGYSVAYGSDKDQIISVPIDESEDPGKPRTNQRAELLAACLGVEALKIRHSARQLNVSVPWEEENDSKSFYVVATDSDYVVKGITE